jgi:hypothetical protein
MVPPTRDTARSDPSSAKRWGPAHLLGPFLGNGGWEVGIAFFVNDDEMSQSGGMGLIDIKLGVALVPGAE